MSNSHICQFKIRCMNANAASCKVSSITLFIDARRGALDRAKSLNL
jgi:hypothetical protein